MRLEWIAVWTIVFCLAPSMAGQESYLRPNDHVIFYSADPAGHAYEYLVETTVLTRLPQHNVLFSRAGSLHDADPESLPDRPTVVVVNSADGAAKPFGEFRQKLQASLPQVRLTVLGTVRDAAAPPAAIRGGISVDIAGVLAAAVEKARAIDPAVAPAMGDPNGAGSALLAANALLQAWRIPAALPAVEIDALRGTVARAEFTTVRELENGRVIAWSQDDQVLPMAVDIMDPSVVLAIQCSDFVSRLDNQILRIRGMAAERYRLTIDGETVGTFHRDQLDTGLNLALLRTPMWRQAMSLLAMARERGELRASRGRLLATSPEQRQSAEWKAAMETLDSREADLVMALQSKAKAGTHDYELQPVER